jgi:hypothetical protein
MGSIDFGLLACKFIGWVFVVRGSSSCDDQNLGNWFEECCRGDFSAGSVGLACGLNGGSNWKILEVSELFACERRKQLHVSVGW